MPAQPRQRIAHRGLGHAEAHTGAGDVFFFKQRLQDDKKVQVDAAERHSVTPVNVKSNWLWNCYGLNVNKFPFVPFGGEGGSGWRGWHRP